MNKAKAVMELQKAADTLLDPAYPNPEFKADVRGCFPGYGVCYIHVCTKSTRLHSKPGLLKYIKQQYAGTDRVFIVDTQDEVSLSSAVEVDTPYRLANTKWIQAENAQGKIFTLEDSAENLARIDSLNRILGLSLTEQDFTASTLT